MFIHPAFACLLCALAGCAQPQELRGADPVPSGEQAGVDHSPALGRIRQVLHAAPAAAELFPRPAAASTATVR